VWSVGSCGSAWDLSGLTQYGSDGTAHFARSWSDGATVPSDPSTGALQNFLQTSITNHNAAPGLNDFQHAPIYVVVSDPASSAQFNGGWNATGTYQQRIPFLNVPENIHMVWIGTSSQGTGVWTDAFTLTLSHELAETISDPDSNGIRINPSPTLPPSLNGPNENQIGDYEPEQGGGIHYGYRLKGAWVQPYWSQADGAYIVPDGNSEKFFLNPIWDANNNFTGKYNLRVRGDQLGANFNDSIRVDKANASQPNNVKATMNGQSATFDAGTITNVNIDTKGGANTVRIAAVPPGVTVNVDSSGASNDLVIAGNDSHSLVGIKGTVNVANTSGQTDLRIDAAADGARTITITSSAVTFSGLSTINYTGGNQWQNGTIHQVTKLEVFDGNGINTVTVSSVPPLTNVILWADFFDVVTGPAKNQIQVIRNHGLIIHPLRKK
jgi:hypothetical protein